MNSSGTDDEQIETGDGAIELLSVRAADEIMRKVLEQRFELRDTGFTTGGPARYAEVVGTGQRIGFITPMSHNFCSTCNRVRVNCRGELFSCLGRGQRFFGVPHHDAGVIGDHFHAVPTAGFFCGGEIGPVGVETFVHGYTASAALLYAP